MNFKRFTAFASALTLSLTLAVSAGAANDTLLPKTTDYTGQFSDIRDSWCEDAVKTCYETGLLQGKTANRFDANSSLSNAQITVITARLCAQLRGETIPKSDGPWYQGSVDYLKTLGIQGTTAYQADMACARTTFVTLLGQGLAKCGVELPVINEVATVPDTYPLPEGTPDYPLTFYRAGILQGSDAWGSFKSGTNLTRGAASAMLARIVDPTQRLHFTLPVFDLCRDAYHLDPDTVLVTIEGQDLTVAQIGHTLAESLCTGTGNMNQALEQVKRNVATLLLCEEKGLVPTAEQQAQAGSWVQERIGKRGMNEAGLRWEQQSHLANALLAQHFGEPSTSQSMLKNAIDQKAATLSLEFHPALLELDQAALLEVCHSAPIKWA